MTDYYSHPFCFTYFPTCPLRRPGAPRLMRIHNFELGELVERIGGFRSSGNGGDGVGIGG